MDAGGKISRAAADSYIREMQNLFVIDDQPAWSVSLRSRTPLRQTPKRHLSDPSIAAAAIGATRDKLLKDFNTLGYLFESLCVRDMRIYATAINASVYHYKDKTDLEADIIVEKDDGAWGAMEVKLGSKQEDEAASNLLSLASRVDTSKRGAPSFLAIITGGKYPFRRKDNVLVIPIGCLAP
jgi:predicted AAA+ superfamily ATPase